MPTPHTPDPARESSAAETPPEAAAASATSSRRKFLGAMTAGVGAAVVAPTVVAAQTDDGTPRPNGRRLRPKGRGGRGGRRPDGGRPRDDDGLDRAQTGQDVAPTGPDRFGRLFDLPPFARPSEALTEALTELGRPGGMMDANDPLDVGPIRLITEPDLSPDNRDNPANTAGVTFVGQFLDHDITRDAGSRLGRPTPARRSTNLRSARFDLDSVYGGGPGESPELYDGFRLRLGFGGQFEDLLRDDQGLAILGDDRNDENLMLSGLQCAFISFHNAVLDDIAGRVPTESDFDRARLIVCRHYQWIIVHEILPQFVGHEMVDDIVANGRRVYTPAIARIPLEFQTSAYRFGHSQIRPSYRANLAGDRGDPFFALVFDPKTFGQDDPNDLTGRSRAARRFIGWQTFFDFGDGEVKPNKRIDTKMSTPLFQLPMFAIPTGRGEDVGPTSLATRNLLRHITWEIPSGQRVAAEMDTEPLTPDDLTDLGQLGANLDRSTPLFFYVLREAEVTADGLHLGPLGGRLVGEVFTGLLDHDPDSYVNTTGPNGGSWRPTLPQRSGVVGGDFTMVDLLTIAGVDPDSRGQ